MRTVIPAPSSPRTAARLLAGAAALALAGGLVACAPEADDAATPTSPTATASQTPVETPATTPTPTPAEELALPASCDEIYSADMRARLEADVPPLNDPGITMTSTENAEALGILDSAAQTLRCTWGLPSEIGLATTVVIVTPDESAALAEAFRNQGFSEAEAAGGTLFETRQETVDYDGDFVAFGESQLLRGSAWIATRWISYEPEGLNADIAAQLWG